MWSATKSIPKTICKQKGIIVRLMDQDRMSEYSANIHDIKEHYQRYQVLFNHAYVCRLFNQVR